jgi:hypothetical protein
MDNTLNCKKIVREVITRIGNLVPDDDFSKTQIILDDESGHYLLVDIGWQDKLRTYLPFVHIDVTPDGKVWLQHDGTDLRIAGLLENEGIPKSSIVLGFKPPYIREMIDEYAVS